MKAEGKIVSENVRQHNRKLIYRYLQSHEQVTRQELVTKLKMSLPTVIRNLDALQMGGWVMPGTQVKNTGGRNAAAYGIRANARFAIGVSLTGHHMNVISMDLKKQVHTVLRRSAVLEADSESYQKKLGRLVRQAMDQDGITPDRLLGVGIAIPSLVSEDGRRAVNPENFTIHGITWDQVARYIPYGGRLIHDSYAAGYAETKSLRGVHNSFYISLSATVGGAMILDDQVAEGSTRKGGEIGHMIVRSAHPKLCYCGKRGCFDTVCRSGVLDSLTDGDIDLFFERLRQGDGEAQARWDGYLEDLALGVHNIRMLYDMNIIVGGYVGTYLNDYLPELCRRVDELDPFQDSAADYLFTCTSKVEPIASGAAQIYIDRFVENLELN